MNTDRLRLWLLVPAALSFLAVLPLPYGYYVFLRLVLTVAAVVAAFLVFKRSRAVSWEVVVLALVAMLFNPFVPIPLSRGVWLPINLAVGGLFAYLALRREPGADQPRP